MKKYTFGDRDELVEKSNQSQQEKKEQGNFQPALETQKKPEQLYDRKKRAGIPDNHPVERQIKDIKLARQCMNFQLIKCKNKDCKNLSCPLNKEYD